MELHLYLVLTQKVRNSNINFCFVTALVFLHYFCSAYTELETSFLKQVSISDSVSVLVCVSVSVSVSVLVCVSVSVCQCVSVSVCVCV